MQRCIIYLATNACNCLVFVLPEITLLGGNYLVPCAALSGPPDTDCSVFCSRCSLNRSGRPNNRTTRHEPYSPREARSRAATCNARSTQALLETGEIGRFCWNPDRSSWKTSFATHVALRSFSGWGQNQDNPTFTRTKHNGGAAHGHNMKTRGVAPKDQIATFSGTSSTRNNSTTT